MLVVLGPSGSGKTYTIFKSLRDPGMVPFALQLIFEGTTSICSDSSESRRSFYLSIFKIYSERGKGERLSDLSPDGGDLFMQHATIKGLQEVIIYNAADAEFLISRAMLRRATTMTNPNSQSRCMLRSGIGYKIMNVELRSQAKPNVVDLAKKERNHQTTRNFAKAAWNVLKQYKEKLKILKDKLSSEKMRNHELEKQLKPINLGIIQIFVEQDMPVSPKAKSSRRSPARTRSKSVSSPSRSGSKPRSLSRSRSLLPAKRMRKSPKKRRVSRSPCGSRSRSLLTL
ncbi:hypothetical protein QYF36_021895 [Acer negundo]|nr:hypothetical protein QYF36_021895 [Acer negundo]